MNISNSQTEAEKLGLGRLFYLQFKDADFETFSSDIWARDVFNSSIVWKRKILMSLLRYGCFDWSQKHCFFILFFLVPTEASLFDDFRRVITGIR